MQGGGVNINKYRFPGAGNVAEFVNCLPSMQEALESVPHIA